MQTLVNQQQGIHRIICLWLRQPYVSLSVCTFNNVFLLVEDLIPNVLFCLLQHFLQYAVVPFCNEEVAL